MSKTTHTAEIKAEKARQRRLQQEAQDWKNRTKAIKNREV